MPREAVSGSDLNGHSVDYDEDPFKGIILSLGGKNNNINPTTTTVII